MEQRRGVVLTREQLEVWVGGSLTDEEVERVEQAIPESSVPDVIEGIANGVIF